jgi:hypothetical protein
MLLSEVIPCARVDMADHIAQRTPHKRIPPAPLNPYIGYSVVAQDSYLPETVIRGSEVGSRSSTAPLSSKYKNSAANLLDRDGDPWAIWNQRNTTAADMPFARTNSNHNTPISQSNDNTKQQTARRHMTPVRHRNVCEDYDYGGEQYPFIQDHCW